MKEKVFYRFLLTMGLALPLACNRLLAAELAISEAVPAHYTPLLTAPPDAVSETPSLTSLAPHSVNSAQSIVQAISAVSHGAAVVSEPQLNPAVTTLTRPLAVRRPPKPTPILVNSCRNITSPGYYVITQNLSAQNACIGIDFTHDVTLTCRNPSVSPARSLIGGNIGSEAGYSILSTKQEDIAVVNSKNVTISGCTAHAPSEDNGDGIEVFNSIGTRIIGNDLENVYVENSSYTYVEGNHILGNYFQTGSSWTNFLNNMVNAYSDNYEGSDIEFDYGSYNQIFGNQIDGKWDGKSPDFTQGADDGILLYYEDNDSIASNNIENTWDAGIESVGTLSDTWIKYNNISKVHETGIGAYFDTAWDNNVIANNTVQNSWYFFEASLYNPIPGETPLPPPSAYYFRNNQIINNQFSSPRISNTFTGAFTNSMIIQLVGVTDPTPAVENNTIANNLLPTNAPGPMLTPGAAFAGIDGGCNVCGKITDDTPISCLSTPCAGSPQ